MTRRRKIVRRAEFETMRYRLIIAGLAICAALVGCESKLQESILPEMTGVWKTSEPKYEGCFFELKKDEISFANAADVDSFLIYRVSKIDISTPREEQFFCTVYYQGYKGERYEFSFYYNPSGGGSIRFKNQIGIKWVKVNSPSIDKTLMEYG
jgi:hypothetical protein